MHDDLSVALRPENVALFHKKRAQFTEVVNLAIEHDPNRAILVGKRLVAGV